jgi:hypothetical protein
MLKKILAIIFILSGLISAQDISGSGTHLDPYLLYNAADIDSIRYIGLGKVYSLQANVNMKEVTDNWVPIGLNSGAPWGGQFWGNGYTIDSLVITTFRTYSGLFGYGSSDTVKNLKITNSKIEFISTATSYNGIVIGYAFTSFYDSLSVSDSRITLLAVDKANSAGSIIGRISGGVVAHCSAINDTLISKGTSSQVAIGGIIGWNAGTLEKSYSNNCYIETNRNASYAGGITAINSGAALNCYTVYCNILDKATTASFIESGGAFGSGSGSISNIYSVSLVTFNQYPAGNNVFSGYQAANGSTSYADTSYFGVTEVKISGTGVEANKQTTSEMKIEENFVGWDFSTVWSIDPEINDGYPYLLDNYIIPEPPEPPAVTLPKRWGLIR